MRGGLVKKRIVDKRGRHTYVWIRPNNPKPNRYGDIMKEAHDLYEQSAKFNNIKWNDWTDEDMEKVERLNQKKRKIADRVLEMYVTGELTKEQIEKDSGVAKVANINYNKYKDVGGEEAYHFSIATDKVLKEGFKTKEQLIKEGKSEGVGGGSGISLTYDLNYAKNLLRAFTFMKDALTGKSKVKEHWEDIKKKNPEGADSIVGQIRSMWGGKKEDVREALDNGKLTYSYSGWGNKEGQAPEDGFVKIFYNSWFMFHPDEEYLALFSSIDHLPKADLGIIKMKLAPKSKAEHLPAEREYRIDSPKIIEEGSMKRI